MEHCCFNISASARLSSHNFFLPFLSFVYDEKICETICSFCHHAVSVPKKFSKPSRLFRSKLNELSAIIMFWMYLGVLRGNRRYLF